ncbi:unnamed protein product [Bursaphelenchus xylophilus]|uniref:(pine wood nematode) hypothetical protein n=1 Tax=Bursaphelenchus xylophilus TaxID=6326 RepID=A0A811KVH8_BURXY|nr:unnamed protein product [Bursaphelenchus xylophilus]CAG9105325.1 unnamed protein product [Bursaphelenchus xylophilus]
MIVIRTDPNAYFECWNGTLRSDKCIDGYIFNQPEQRCQPAEDHTLRKRSMGVAGASRTGDMCAFNTDCQSGMYCFNGACTCLSDYVAIAGYCWQKVNPGDSGCVEDLQCDAVWPGAKCSRAGMCECPEFTTPAKTRDGTMCVSAGVPPACPLPEPINAELPNPATLLANPTTHPLGADSYMPVLCSSGSNEVINSNGGDGSTWCIYPDGDNDIYIADIYNCIPHPQVKHEFFPEYSDTIDGICCHSRAFVCVQPMEQGEEPSVPRWWYNSVTGTCSQFLWDPNQADNVSPNNFRTVEHCESYCRDTCRRGPVQFNQHNRNSIIDETPITNCLHHAGGCGTEFHCTVIGSHQHCCPTVAHICSAMGGRAHDYVALENFDRGVAVAGYRPVSRFYYDQEQGRCASFVYDGLGNYNNFFTKQDCENFCSKLVCEYGNPLRIGEDWQRCETNNDCPSTHQCESGHKVCCPTAQSICTQPKRFGDCTSSVRRFWYNAATRQCELFQYTGCQGNDNNFDSLMDCQQKCRNIALEPKCPQGRAHRDANGHFYQCSMKNGGKMCPPNYQCYFDGTTHGCCPTKAYTCSLSPDKGIQCGSGRSFRYYFNAHKQSCESFQYEGCDGNSNNFQNVEDCQDYCGVGGCPNGGQPLRDLTTNQFIACQSDGQTCPQSHECVTINFNGNIAHRCCPTKAHICTLPPQQGNQCTKISVTRFYFNIVTKECGRFSYNGCNGNLNNFASADQCSNFCTSSACRPGESTFKDINTKKVVECSPSVINSCPLDYQCKHDPLTGRHVCCGTPPSDVCPEGEKAYVNPLDETVKECTINMAGSCPADYLCRFSPSHNRYYCCASRNGNMCPDGRALYRTPRTFLPTRCTLSQVQNGCPDGFSCQSRVDGVLQGYCCTSNSVCRNGADFLIDDKTKMPQVCMPGAFAMCPAGYRCNKASNSASTGYCCKGEIKAITEGCPPGEYAYTKQKEIVQCDPFNIQDKGCPAHYSCQYAIAFQRYQCCGKEPLDEEALETQGEDTGCMNDQVAFINHISKEPHACTVNAENQCPLGYFCQFSDKNKQFQCCGQRAGCPNRKVAYIGISGTAQECKPGVQQQCPGGYTCIRGEENKFICCTSEEPELPGAIATTPTTTTELIDPSTETTEKPDGQYRHHNRNSAEISVEIGPVKPRGHMTCRPDEHFTNGQCVPRRLGEACITTDQCPKTSVCSSFVCRCPDGTKQAGQICLPDSDEEADIVDENGESILSTTRTPTIAAVFTRETTKTPIRNTGRLRPEVYEIEDKEKELKLQRKCKEDEVMHKGHCLKRRDLGESCVTKDQCNGGAGCYRGRCRCPPNKAGFMGRCEENVCGGNQFRLPQTDPLTSNVLQCAHDNSVCRQPYKCTFSKILKDYICCKSTNRLIEENIPTIRPITMAPNVFTFGTTRSAKTHRTTTVRTYPFGNAKTRRSRRKCPDGSSPLMFTHTDQPVKCTPQRSCPKDYYCSHMICCLGTPTTPAYDEEDEE